MQVKPCRMHAELCGPLSHLPNVAHNYMAKKSNRRVYAAAINVLSLRFHTQPAEHSLTHK